MPFSTLAEANAQNEAEPSWAAADNARRRIALERAGLYLSIAYTYPGAATSDAPTRVSGAAAEAYSLVAYPIAFGYVPTGDVLPETVFALPWPREDACSPGTGVQDRDGRTIAPDTIPPELYVAEARLAALDLATPLFAAPVAAVSGASGANATRTQARQKVKAGKVEVDITYENEGGSAVPAGGAHRHASGLLVDVVTDAILARIATPLTGAASGRRLVVVN